MGDEEDKVPGGSTPEATAPAESPSTEEDTDAEDESWGWDTEIPEGEEPDEGDEPESDDATETDNSQPPSDTPTTGDEPAGDPRGAPPAGFSTWDEVIAAATATRAPKPQAPSAPRGRALPSLPHDDDPLVTSTVGELADMDPAQRAEALKSLPGPLAEKAVTRFKALTQAHRELRNDPLGFVKRITDEVARSALESSVFADRFLQLENTVYAKTGQEFLLANKISSEEQKDLLGLMKRGVPRDEAVKIVQERRELRQLKANQQGVETSKRQIEANQAASRAQQSAKGKSRTPGNGMKAAFKAAGTDVKKLAKLVEKELKAKGL